MPATTSWRRPARRHPASKISYATTTTVSTQLSSGGIPVGAPTVTVTTGPATDLDGVCYAPGTAPALPAPNPQRAGLAAGPFPPGGCAAWPCTVSTANAGGSINSLADVAQYYYMTDLRPGDARQRDGRRHGRRKTTGPTGST